MSAYPAGMRWANVYNRTPTLLRLPVLLAAGIAGYFRDACRVVRPAAAPPSRRAPNPRRVGTCGDCGGPVVYSPVARYASCPCGRTIIGGER